MNKSVINFLKINERLCVLWIKRRFKNYSLINAHAPSNKASGEDKDAFYNNLNKVYNDCPRYDIKLILADPNAKIGKEKCFKPMISGFSLHDETNENGLRLIDFATEKGMVVIKARFFSTNQPTMPHGSPLTEEPSIRLTIVWLMKDIS